MGEHPKEHPALSGASKRRRARRAVFALPALIYEVGVALTAGWIVFESTGDWVQGVSAGLLWLFGGGTRRLIDLAKK